MQCFGGVLLNIVHFFKSLTNGIINSATPKLYKSKT